jgi:hypothetical protein
VLDNLVFNADEMANFLFLEFIFEMLRIGYMEEWYSKELREFVHIMIVCLIRGS